jgi:hypothetical protein
MMMKDEVFGAIPSVVYVMLGSLQQYCTGSLKASTHRIAACGCQYTVMTIDHKRGVFCITGTNLYIIER